MSNSNSDWKFQTYLTGSLIGLFVGIIAAHLYTRAVEESKSGNAPDRLKANDMVKLGLSTLGLVRQITELGNTSKN